MSLRALLVSRDAEAVSALRTVMRDLDLESEVCADLEPAVERLAEGKTSAVVVDYEVEHASELLKLMRQNYASSCVALAMVKGLASIQAAYDMGASFVLIKPVSTEAASRSLAEAMALMRRTRRPARMVVPTLAYVNLGSGQDSAIILDISEGGMAIQTLQPVQANGPLRLEFDLPGVPGDMNVSAEIVWADSSGRAGLRFVGLSEAEQQRLRDWVRINTRNLRSTARLPEQLSLPAWPQVGDVSWDVKLLPAGPTVAQRMFATLVDAGIVILASVVFFVAFLVCVRQLPASGWVWPVALAAPVVFWLSYLYLFLAHPRGTLGMQVAAIGRAASDKPDMFDLLPPSPLAAASSRVLTWLEAHSVGAPRIDEAGMATSPAPVASGAAKPSPSRTGLARS
jgi:DNA-binding response OmpR family regulator